MIIPKSDFRPDPARAIYVNGTIDLDLIHKLTPEILKLQHDSREPITVYIDSPGGRLDYMFALLRLLKAPTQDYGVPCGLITVVTRKAASAAADLLSAGTYAIAYPDSVILFHGGRLSEDKPLTAERLSFLSELIRLTNEGSAMGLAREIEYRFMFRFVSMRGSFAAVRQKHDNNDISDLDCFLEVISANLSRSAKQVLQAARERYARYNLLVEHVVKATKKALEKRTELEKEAAQIKAIVAFEVKQNKADPTWSFHEGGVNRLIDDFLLFREYQGLAGSGRFQAWCSKFGFFMLAPEEKPEIKALPEEERRQRLIEKVGPSLQPIWSFFVALCYALQRGENELSATDAYWLGLVDEVFGDAELRNLREIYEHQPDAQLEADGEKAKAASAGGEVAEPAAGS